MMQDIVSVQNKQDIIDTQGVERITQSVYMFIMNR